MSKLEPLINVPPTSLEFAASLPVMPTVFNCRFLYPAADADKYGIGTFDTYPGRYTNTLFFLEDNAPVDQLVRMLDYQKSVGATCIPFYIANDFSRTYPTMGGKYRGEIDEAKLDRWYAYCLAIIQGWGIWPIPMGHCCNKGSEYAQLDANEFRRVIKAVVNKLDPLVPFWGAGWEVSEFWEPWVCDAAASIYHEFTRKPVILHNQGWEHAMGANINGLAYEWGHHPKYGQDISVDALRAEYKTVSDHIVPAGKALIAGEWTVFTQTPEAAAQRKGLTGYLPWTYGAWN
ncbi:MAG: hypothetical protein WC359_12630 [Dehalococcoidia bacterium]